jgi:hypothetical protein
MAYATQNPFAIHHELRISFQVRGHRPSIRDDDVGDGRKHSQVA